MGYFSIVCCCLIPQETAMQVFQCHYQEGRLMSGLYFDYIKDVLQTASEGTSGFSCKPPPCNARQPGASFICFFCFFLMDAWKKLKQHSNLLVGRYWFAVKGTQLWTGIRFVTLNEQANQVIIWLKEQLAHGSWVHLTSFISKGAKVSIFEQRNCNHCTYACN